MTRKKEPSGNDTVGYGRPPREHRFKKGRSANPNGRPKGTSNFAATVKKVLAMPVRIERNGKVESVPSQEGLLRVFRELALKGNAKAIERILDYARSIESETAAPQVDDDIAPEEQSLLDAYVERARGRIEEEVEILNPGKREEDDDEQ